MYNTISIKIVLLTFTSFILLLLSYSTGLANDPGLIRTGVKVIANPGSSLSGDSTRCEGTTTSCGLDGNCLDLTGLIYCVDGRIVETICRYNRPRNRTTSTPCKNINFDLNVKDENGLNVPINLTLYKPGTNDTVKKFEINGSGSINTFEEKIDFNIDYDNSNLMIKVKNLDIESLNSTSPSIIIDSKVEPNIPGVNVYIAYKVELPSEFTYSSITLSVKYSDITVEDENNLTFYRCGSFNSTTNECNEEWSTIDTSVLDTTNKIASITISNFSVYALGEPSDEEDECEDFGYTNSCSEGMTCQVVQVTPALQCCNCIPLETTTTTTVPQETTTTTSSRSTSSGHSHSTTSISTTITTSTLPQCIKHKPRITVNPSIQSGLTGDTLEYNITIRNMDSPECDDREFELDFELPEKWMIDYDPVGKIKAGDTKVIKITVTPKKEASINETYQLSVYGFDVETGEESNTAYFKYIINATSIEQTTVEQTTVEQTTVEQTTVEQTTVEQTKLLSPTTGLASLIVENKHVLVISGIVGIAAYWFLKFYPNLVKESSGIYEYRGEDSGEKLMVRIEPNTQRENKQEKVVNDCKPEKRQINERMRKALIEEIRRRALREDERMRKGR